MPWWVQTAMLLLLLLITLSKLTALCLPPAASEGALDSERQGHLFCLRTEVLPSAGSSWSRPCSESPRVLQSRSQQLSWLLEEPGPICVSSLWEEPCPGKGVQCSQTSSVPPGHPGGVDGSAQCCCCHAMGCGGGETGPQHPWVNRGYRQAGQGPVRSEAGGEEVWAGVPASPSRAPGAL